MAYRVFPSGQVPTAEILQKYLMNQVVITCASTARPPTPVEGMTIFEVDTGTFRAWYGGIWARLAKAGDWTDGGALTVGGDLTVGGSTTVSGTVAGATVSSSGAVNAGGLMVARVVKGKVAGTQTDTAISASSDTNIGGANVQNVPVIAGRAYMSTVAIDYNTGTTGAIGRFDFKLWNGSVGGSQLGGTVRFPMAGTASSASNRNARMTFVWEAPSTTTIANLNLSGLSSTSGCFAQINAAFLHIVEEIGLASTITNL